MPATPFLYRLSIRGTRAAGSVLGLLAPTIGTVHRDRLAATGRLQEWGLARLRHRPLVWFHAASVGEGIQASQVLKAVRERCPEVLTLYTYFSPSVSATFADSVGADYHSFLPYDAPTDVSRVLEAVRPDVLVFAKHDLWPQLATTAHSLGCRVVMVAGTVRQGSSRLRNPARRILRCGYKPISLAGVVAPADGERLVRLGVDQDRIRLTGDPRGEAVEEAIARAMAHDHLLGAAAGGTLVAGSTWPRDEAVLLRAFASVRAADRQARLILVPHNPSGPTLNRIERSARRLGLPPVVRSSTLRDQSRGLPSRLARLAGPLLLVDEFGLLARLYGVGTLAWVGGGYSRRGLHSVLEPAGWGLPVLFGSRWQGNRDAERLVEAGAGVPLPPDTGGAVRTLTEWWRRLTADEAERQAYGRRAKTVVESDRGASGRNASLVLEALMGRPPLLRR